MRKCLKPWLSAVFVFLALIGFAAPDIDAPYRFPFYTGKILPTPQQVVYYDRTAPLDNTAILMGAGFAPDDGRLRELRCRIAAFGGELKIVKSLDESKGTVIVLGAHPEAAALLRDKAPPDKPEGYLIAPVEQAGRTIVCLEGHDDLGLLWAVISLNQMIADENGKPVLHLAAVSDYPATPGRAFMGTLTDQAFRQAVAFKLNRLTFKEPSGYRPRDLPDSWRTPFPEESRALIRAAGDYLNPLGIEWYGGGVRVDIRPEHQIRSKSAEDFKIVFDQISIWMDAGAHAQIYYDDLRFPLSADDQRDFGSAREADIYFINKLYDAIQQKRPGAKLLFCPPFYWGPTSPAMYPEDRDEYLRAIGERLPKAIGIWWTGPRVKSTEVTPEKTAWIIECIQRKPWYGQNACGSPHMHHYHFYADPVPGWRDWFYPGFFNEIEAFAVNGGHSLYSLPSAVLADCLWNPAAYDPESSIKDAAMKFYGVAIWPALVELNKRLAYFDRYELKVSPFAARNVDEIKAELDKLEAAYAAVQKLNPAFDSVHMEQIRRWYCRLQKNPALKEFFEATEISRKQADAEIQLRKDDIFISAYDFDGGKQGFYAMRCERRLMCALHGSQSACPRASTRFELDPFPPSGDYQLIMSGQDNDADKKCRIRISVNDQEIFIGANPFVQAGWSRHTFTVPVLVLKRNNVLTVENIEPSAIQSGPPWVILNYAVLRKTTD